MKKGTEKHIRIETKLDGGKTWFHLCNTRPTKVAAKKAIARNAEFWGPKVRNKYRAHLITITTTKEPVEI